MFFSNMKEAVAFAKQIKADIESHGYTMTVYDEKSKDCNYGLFTEGFYVTIMTTSYKTYSTKNYTVNFSSRAFSYEKTNKTQTTTNSAAAQSPSKSATSTTNKVQSSTSARTTTSTTKPATTPTTTKPNSTTTTPKAPGKSSEKKVSTESLREAFKNLPKRNNSQ